MSDKTVNLFGVKLTLVEGQDNERIAHAAEGIRIMEDRLGKLSEIMIKEGDSSTVDVALLFKVWSVLLSKTYYDLSKLLEEKNE